MKTKDVTPGRCFGYARGSLSRQTLTIEAQTAAIIAFAAAKGLPVPQIFVDSGEGGPPPFAGRPASSKLLEILRPGDHIIVTRVDRGFRNLADFLHWFDSWLQTGIRLYVVDFGGNSIDPATPIGKLLFQVLALLAEWEHGQIVERHKAINAHFRSQGLTVNGFNGVKIGFRPVKNTKGKGFFIVPDPRARKIMGQVYDWWQDGQTHDAIRQHLRAIKAPMVGCRMQNSTPPNPICG